METRHYPRENRRGGRVLALKAEGAPCFRNAGAVVRNIQVKASNSGSGAAGDVPRLIVDENDFVGL